MAEREQVRRHWWLHMREDVTSWLLGPNRACLHSNALMLFGNPYLFQGEVFLRHVDEIEPIGLFYNALHAGRLVTLCYPVFGAPMAAMYAEIMMDNGVRSIVACGYVGGITPVAAIGSYALVSAAIGFDGTTISYGMGKTDIPAAAALLASLPEKVQASGSCYHQGRIANIDALMLEDDSMITDLRSRGYGFIDLEMACLFGLARARDVTAAARANRDGDLRGDRGHDEAASN